MEREQQIELARIYCSSAIFENMNLWKLYKDSGNYHAIMGKIMEWADKSVDPKIFLIVLEQLKDLEKKDINHSFEDIYPRIKEEIENGRRI